MNIQYNSKEPSWKNITIKFQDFFNNNITKTVWSW